MGEGDGAGTKDKVEEGDVREDGNESGLEEETEDHVAIDHTLLGDGKVTGLADEQVAPLHAHNRDEIATLSVAESFSGVTDLGAGDGGVAIEGETLVVGFSPAAAGPGVDRAFSEEQTEIDHVVSCTIPVEDHLELGVSLVGISVVLVVRVVGVGVCRNIALFEG
jgi:hypothetical protein